MDQESNRSRHYRVHVKDNGVAMHSVENGDHLWMQTDSQMCIVTGPNIEMAIKLIRRLKNIFERKLGLIFQNKETVLELNGCRIEAFPPNHIDSFKALENQFYSDRRRRFI